MRVAILFSGGKDSVYGLYWALRQGWECTLVSVESPNPDSYMFHTVANIRDTQASSLELPLVKIQTSGKKEVEVQELKDGLSHLPIDGVVSGAIASEYQRTRIDHICKDLGIQSFTPLWHRDPVNFMHELITLKFKVIFSKVAAYGFDESWLGLELNEEILKRLVELNRTHRIHIAGEGGEFETLVLDGPIFRRTINIEYEKIWEEDSGIIKITRASLI
jgi:ABC transporter with metal-binding/Fe-S-binding domain ATP-binding protein